MAVYKVPPPVFCEKVNYERWKNEVDMWSAVTDLKKEQQGLALALSLPIESQVRDKVMTELSKTQLSSEDGLNVLLNFLDKIYKKDELESAYEAWSDFQRYKKVDSMSIGDYIMEFDKRYKAAKKFNMTLSVPVLAFQLLENGGLTQRDRQLTLTAVDYSKKDTLYDQMIAALKKFFGNQAKSFQDCDKSAVTVKREPSIAENVYATSYTQQRGKGRFQRNMRSSNARYRDADSEYGKSRESENFEYRPTGRTVGDFKGKDGSFKPRRTNPLDAQGNPTLCLACGSQYHYARYCPDRRKQVFETTTEEEILLTGSIGVHPVQEEMKVLVAESLNCAVLDCACTSTVCGDDWLKCYLDSLSEEELSRVKDHKSHAWFKFGDGIKVKSLRKVDIPCRIADKNCFIRTDVVSSDIPLLLGKPSMKKARMKLDIEHDKAVIFEKNVNLECTPSGHYCIPLLAYKNSESIVKQAFITTEQSDEKDKKKVVLKLHKQFAHPSGQRLKLLMKDAGVMHEYIKLVDEIVNNCDICKKYKKTPARPVVSIPLARDFNDVVAMDLKEWDKKKNICFLHLIDMATRYSVSVVIHKKERQVIIDKILEKWIGTGLGTPEKFLTDNGGEFCNSEFRDMCENLNITVMNTAAESPFSNGLCERNHAVIDDMVCKILADQPECQLSTALAWAVHAKNSLQMVGGYSPYQLVFGRNPKLPSVLVDKPPALEGTTISEVFAKHLNALHASRQAFIKAEASERVRRALRYQIRPNGNYFQCGDDVYYKRDGYEEWKGPGKVIGQDGKVVIIKHGNQCVRVHSSRITKTSFAMGKPDDFERADDEQIDKLDTQVQDGSALDEFDEIRQKKSISGVTEFQFNQQKSVIEDACEVNEPSCVKVRGDIPKVGQKVKYVPCGEQEWKETEILSRAGKATGRYCNWLNIQDKGEEPKAINWETGVDDWYALENIDKDNNSEALSAESSVEMNEINVVSDRLDEKGVIEAKQRELKSWQEFDVYEEVSDMGQPYLTVRWVCTEKLGDNATPIIKARLVARGFEENISGNDIRVDSPTAGKAVLRIFIALLSLKSWKCYSIDVKAAFLQGNKFERDVHLKPPKEANNAIGKLWKLKKCVYGLNDASRVWYFTVRAVLLNLGCVQLQTDQAMFYWYHNGKFSGLFLMHVDDFIWGGNEEFESHVINKIKSKFEIGNQGCGIFKYIGLDIKQANSCITVDQKAYLDSIRPVNISCKRSSQKADNINKEEFESLRSLIGQLNWLSTNTRPDISYDVLELSSSMKDPTVDNVIKGNKVLKKLKMDECSVRFPCLGDPTKLKLVIFSDASHGNLPDGYSSAGGFVIFLVGEDCKCCPLAWESKKIRRVVKSTLAAETLALVEAVDMGYYLQNILSEILFTHKISIPMECYVDNHSLWDNVHSTKNVSEKRLRIDLASLKQMLDKREISAIKWIESSHQLSDCFTKRGVCTQKLIDILKVGYLNL